MVLKLAQGSIQVLNNNIPEDLSNTQITYRYELGTQGLTPVLYIHGDVYTGKKVNVTFNKIFDRLSADEHSITLQVDLIDTENHVIRSYKNEFIYMKTFTLGTKEQIDVYKALALAYNKIEELEKKGEIL